MIGFNGVFVRDGKRPGGHGYKGTIKKVLEDIQLHGALTPPEKSALAAFSGPTKQMARDLKDQNWLSTNGYAVCHKIPYTAVERAFEDLMNEEYNSPGTNAFAWSAFDELMNQVYYGSSHGHVGSSTAELLPLMQVGQEHVAATQANGMLSDFDKDSDNLYFGFQKTNSSIGENHDYHYDVLSLGIAPVVATPRGAAYGKLLNDLETALGLTLSTNVEIVDASNVRWVMTSGVYGTKSADTGYVVTV